MWMNFAKANNELNYNSGSADCIRFHLVRSPHGPSVLVNQGPVFQNDLTGLYWLEIFPI